MKSLREMIDIVEGKISESIDVGGISHSIVSQPGGRHQVVVKHGDKVMHTSLHNSEEDAKKSLASQVAHSKKMLKVDEGSEGEAQEYTVRVVDEEGSGYTVKVTATSEQGALHKAIVKVRNSGARPEHARIIRQDIEEEITPEAIEKVESLYKDNK